MKAAPVRFLMLQGKSLHLHLTKKPHLRIIKKYSREEYFYTGDWSNGMIGVSKTFGGSSILSSPALKRAGSAKIRRLRLLCFICKSKGYHNGCQIRPLFLHQK